MTFELLSTIDSPQDLRALPRESLPRLTEELRAFLIESVGRTGGHLASNLGTVELTVALHRVFDTPHDRIVWDVGHQAYAHKILTGRREAMARLRMLGGISGFPRRSESPFDAFGTAHSSTSISAALAMAVAARRRGDGHQAIAVIGDGAMSAGLAYEALNNAGTMDADVLVILNDNEMSISPPVGAMHRHLGRLTAGAACVAARKAAERLLGRFPPLRRIAGRLEPHAKAAARPATMFEQLGFNYTGPIDGHDLDGLLAALETLRGQPGPRLLHIVTRKGCGYERAETDPVLYHGVSKFEPATGLGTARVAAVPTYTQVFGEWLCDAAAADERVMAITPAMREGSGLVDFAARFPDRHFDVGIAEQHAVTFAAGLACEGLKPVVAIYSTFLQRAYDQLIHDVQIQNLPVLFAIDRAGLAGADGATHHGAFDLSYLRCIPNLVIMVPSDENLCRQMLTAGLAHDGPAVVRYPRGAGVGVPVVHEAQPLPIGRGELRRSGRRVAILAFGPLLHAALDAADTLDATVVDMRFVKPMDDALVAHMARSHDLLVTLEDNAIQGGAGSAVAESLHAQRIEADLLQLGLPDGFVDHGEQSVLLSRLGLDAPGIVAAVRARVPAAGRVLRVHSA